MNCLINIRDYLLPRLKEFVFFDVSREEATYCEYIRISFKIHLETCIRNLDKKNKENFVKELLNSNDNDKIKDLLDSGADLVMDDICIKYAPEFRKVLFIKK